jgi:GDP-D-mannose dehydratase
MEIGRNIANDKIVVRVDQKLFDNRHLSNTQVGNPSKARGTLGWKAQKTFEVF